MLFEGSEEDPAVPGLAILAGTVRWLPSHVKRPQMQWNRLEIVGESPLFNGLDDAWMYFVHSLHPADSVDVVATAEYGGVVNAAFQRANVFATQFHPEKSGGTGLALLANFVRLCDSRVVSA
jgi:glutamine amidotransferase